MQKLVYERIVSNTRDIRWDLPEGLTAGELAGVPVRLVLQPHQLQHIGNAPLHIPRGGPDGPHGEGQVLIYRLFVDKAEILEDDAQGPPHEGHLPGADVVQAVPVDHELALGEADLPGDKFDDGGLAGPGGSHQKDELPVVNAQVDALQGLGAVVVLLINVNKAYHVR